MRFILTYDGRLPPNGGPQDKHEIRKQFHPQLKRQWEIEDSLVALADGDATLIGGFMPPAVTKILHGSFTFIPLVAKNLHLVCSLDITFLRPEEPGDLVRQGGDIDNRIKTLLDSLSVPQHDNQIQAFVPGADEDPFFCLLEDDCLVTGLQVRTERLLRPQTSSGGMDVHLDLAVIVRPTRVTNTNVKFLGGWL